MSISTSSTGSSDVPFLALTAPRWHASRSPATAVAWPPRATSSCVPRASQSSRERISIGCGGLAGEAELLSGIAGVSSRPVQRILLLARLSCARLVAGIGGEHDSDLSSRNHPHDCAIEAWKEGHEKARGRGNIKGVLPTQKRDTIRDDVNRYLQFVDTEDWRANLRQLPPGLSDALTALLSFNPQGSGQREAQRRATNAVEAALQARRDRILLSEAAISPPQWIVIIVLDALILVTIAMVQVRRHITTEQHADLLDGGRCLPGHPQSQAHPIRTVGAPGPTITPPCAVISVNRAAGRPPINTVGAHGARTRSGGPTHTTMSVIRAAGRPPINTVGAPGATIGPPTCGTTTVTMGQTCMSVSRAAGIPIRASPAQAGRCRRPRCRGRFPGRR
jgi:hypothetical protein